MTSLSADLMLQALLDRLDAMHSAVKSLRETRQDERRRAQAVYDLGRITQQLQNCGADGRLRREWVEWAVSALARVAANIDAPDGSAG